MLRSIDVSRTYGTERVLEDLSLSVGSGEVVAVIGPSGVGKTTVLRLLSLSEAPDDGTIELAGTDAWAVDETERLQLRRRIGMVFQEASLFDASVARNVEYGLRVRRSWADRLRGEIRSIGRSSGGAEAVSEALNGVGLGRKIGGQ
jgi:tungstate transport system ATP-binding protein